MTLDKNLSAPIQTAATSQLLIGLWGTAKDKIGSLAGKGACRLGSPYTIALILFMIGILGSIKILPIGIALSTQFSLIGFFIFIITMLRHQETRQQEWMTTNLLRPAIVVPGQ